MPPKRSCTSSLLLESGDIWKQQTENIHSTSSSKLDLPGSFGDLSRPISLSFETHKKRQEKKEAKSERERSKKRSADENGRKHQYYHIHQLKLINYLHTTTTEPRAKNLTTAIAEDRGPWRTSVPAAANAAPGLVLPAKPSRWRVGCSTRLFHTSGKFPRTDPSRERKHGHGLTFA